MNPEGFWECQYTVRGVSYHAGQATQLADLKTSAKVMKLVSQGLVVTDPQYIDRIIFMLRHPRAVAKSQEDLSREVDLKDLGKVHTPAMFNQVTLQAARWFEANPNVPVLVVEYDELIENPAREVERVKAFLGESGEWDKATATIQPKLRRSVPEDVESDLWEDAENIYKWATVQEWPKITGYFKELRATDKANIQFFCTRRGAMTNPAICNVCKTGRPVPQFVKTAQKKDIDWKAEPCLWDVEFNPDHEGERPTIQQSIAENFWAEHYNPTLLQKMRLGDKVAAVTKAVGVKPCNGCEKRRAKLNGEAPNKVEK